MPTRPASRAGSLVELIAAKVDDLTPSERRLAETIIADPAAVVFGTVADLARRVDVSGPTVVRFATKLGFDGYSALQRYAQLTVAERLRRPTDRIRRNDGGRTAWDDARSAALSGVETVFQTVTPETVRALAEPIASAQGRVWILSSDTASAAAHVLHSGVSLLRPGVVQLTGRSHTSDLLDASATDVLAVIDSPRYERRIVESARWLADLGVSVVAITDGPMSPLVALADVWCPIDVHAVGPFDSALPSVAVVELVVADVARLLSGAATERLDRAETLWERDRVFIDG